MVILDKEIISIFVTVGTNQYDFARMFKIVQSCLKLIGGDLSLILQHGYTDRNNLPFIEGSRIKVIRMLSREDAENAYKTADIVFSHAGVGSIYNSLKYNRPTILVPRLAIHNEFSDDHQLQIANELKRNELIFLVDKELEELELLQFLERNVNKEKLEVDLVNEELASFMKGALETRGSNSKVLVVASAGGHITEAVCAASKLNCFSLVTTLTSATAVSADRIYIVGRSQFNPLKYIWNTIRAIKILIIEKPDSIFSTGGPICLPYAMLAKILNIKFVYLDTLSRVTELSNTAVFLNKYNLTKNIFCQWSAIEKQYPNIKNCGKVFTID